MSGPLGKQTPYVYLSDDGNAYSYIGRKVTNDAVLNTADTTGHDPVPKFTRKRVIYLEGRDGSGKLVKKVVPVGGTAHPAWTTPAATFSIDGVTFTKTGQRGELRKLTALAP